MVQFPLGPFLLHFSFNLIIFFVRQLGLVELGRLV